MSDRTEYNKRYYARHKKEISDNRKTRYWTDDDYRREVLDKAKDRYQRKRKSPDKSVGHTVKKIDGLSLFTIRYAAAMVGRGKDFIRDWEQKGFIPRTLYTDSRGWRLYTEIQIKLMAIAIGNYNKKRWGKLEVKNYLHQNWRVPNVRTTGSSVKRSIRRSRRNNDRAGEVRQQENTNQAVHIGNS